MGNILRHLNTGKRLTLIAIAVQGLCAGRAMAIDIDTGNSDLKIRWDNSVKYSAAVRLNSPATALLGNPNLDDGDRNFSRTGLISNRVDLLSDFDLVYRENWGLRLSGAAWYDDVYNSSTHNNSPFTYNAASVPASQFPQATRDLHGRKAELLDAFVFGKGEVNGMRVSGRVGRHTLLWGETLFFGANGIASGQAPVDVVKLLSVPGSQFKEIIRPVGQISGSVQISSNVQVGAYLQPQWEASRLPGVGSYFSGQDLFAVGGERFFLGGPALARGPDLRPTGSGQGGVQVRFRLPDSATDLGVYAIRYNDKSPQLYISPLLGQYSIAYHEGIRAFGASASRTFGDVNLAGEASVRHNAPLVNDASPNLTFAQPTQNNQLYPVGKTAHLNISAIWTPPSMALFPESTLLAEVAWNRALSVSNGGKLAVNSSRDALAMRAQFVPVYRQVMPGLDLEVPIGIGYNPQGNSQAVSFFNGGVKEGGDLSLGINGNYLNKWKFGLNYTHYYGSIGTTTNLLGQLTFKQNLRDRDFVSFSLQTTF